MHVFTVVHTVRMQMLMLTSTEERARILLAKMPNPSAAGHEIMQVVADGQSCSIM
jgi:hypothetical protein